MASPTQLALRPYKSPPPPSAPLIKLQSLGLELGPTGSRTRLHTHQSTLTPTASDLDKPLPLEPMELSKSRSSTTSVETTITNIIDLYTKPTDTDIPSLPGVLHTVYSYRDSLASLLDRRLEFDDELLPAPLQPQNQPSLHIDTISHTTQVRGHNQEGLEVHCSDTGKKTAPSFREFSRALQKKREEMVSPFSAWSLEQQQWPGALDPLTTTTACSSPDISPRRSTSEVGGPGPLDASEKSDVIESRETVLQSRIGEMGVDEYYGLDLSFTYPAWEVEPRRSSDSGIYTSVGQVSQHTVKEATQEPFHSDKTDSSSRIISAAAEINPASEKGKVYASIPWRNSGFGIGQTASDWVRRVSCTMATRRLTGAEVSGSGSVSAVGEKQQQPSSQRQRSIPPTPYQLYGPAIWKKDKGKGNSRAREKGNMMLEPDSQDKAQSGRDGHRISGALAKLTRRASQKRRERLKSSITLIGPVDLSLGRNGSRTFL